MYETILIPIDGSPGAKRAAAEAIDLAADSGGRVHALYVVSGGGTDAWADVVGESVSGSEVTANGDRPRESVLRERGERAVQAVAERAEEHGVECVTAVVDGRPQEQILEYARNNDVDLVVMGTHGRSGLQRFILGSVTEGVVRRAPVPVLSVTEERARSVSDPEAARAAARRALQRRGHEEVGFPEEPYRQRSSWVVRAESDGELFNVHVSATGETSVARIREVG